MQSWHRWHRVVLKETINNDQLIYPFKVGEQILNDSDYKYLRENYSSSVVEIQMSADEWLKYGADIAVESYEKAMKLANISESMGLDVSLPVAFEPRTGSLGIDYLSSLEGKERKLNPESYGGGFDDVVGKACSYKQDVDRYEEAVFSKIGTNERQR